MALIRRRNRQDRYRATRRRVASIVGFLLLVLAVPFALRVRVITPQSSAAGSPSSAMRRSVTVANILEKRNEDDKNVVILTLQLDDQETVDVRLHLFADQAPNAAQYVRELATNPKQTCSKCTVYRGEPVPDYWGSKEYPDRYFDGGRWGPPYALVQGGLIPDSSSDTSPPPPAESYNPIIQRGMVAWAGGKGGPHFFVALAHHPEWGHGHTIFAKVIEEDMVKVDALLSRPLFSTKPKRPPIVSNFVTPIPFRLRMQQ